MSITHSEENGNSSLVETTPLISQLSSTSKRTKSYSSTLSIPSKRRLHVKLRNHKSLDKAYVKTIADDNDEEYASSNTTSSSPSAVGQGTTQTRPSPTPDVSIHQQPSSSLSAFFKRPRSSISNVSLTLENSGSVARDHLASERTFLAYVRTSLAMASSGVALVQLFTVASANLRHSPEHRLHRYIRPLGAMTIAMGLIVLIIGVMRYFSVQAALTKGLFPVARTIVAFVTMTLTLLVIVTFGILVAGKLEPPAH